MTVRIHALAAATVAAALSCASPAHAEPGDSGFLSALDKMGITYPDAADAVAGGHLVCDYLVEGHTANQAAKAVKNANPSLTLTSASQFVSIAHASYCEQA
ncbi:DUF732 domain-containing protein [Mycolicibacter arupensis]|uniref:DUF732 domain-containing protein n=1 Tax=Mycolicibacter arupensis TaxID=342002 RepID=UPI003B3BE954